MAVSGVFSEPLQRLRTVLESYGSCVVAYSGGVDSVLVAVVAKQVLGDRALAAIADSPSLPRRELDDALQLGRRFGFRVRVIRTREFENPAYTENPVNRCYFCKHALFTELAPVAASEGFDVIVYGENASDVGDYRPGATAAAEFQVRAPLKEANLTKHDIRSISAELGLPTVDKPQMPCLSSRIPYGQPVTTGKLRMIEAAEAVLKDLGFRDVRVRHHESEGEARGPTRRVARIELGVGELDDFVEREVMDRVEGAFRRIGYSEVTLDPKGYRRGSLNEELEERASGVARRTAQG